MRILMLSWRGPNHPRAGGAEVYTKEILTRLMQKGHEVEWYSASYSGAMPCEQEGVRLTYGAKGMNIYVSGYRYAKKNHHADVIVDQINTLGFGTFAIKKPVVSLIHQLAENVWDVECKPPVSWVGKWMEPRFLKKYKKIPFVTVSPSTESDVRQLGWTAKGVIVPNGMDVVHRVFPKSSVPVLVFLARFGAKAKRLSHAVQIFEQVARQYSDAELWVIGRGEAPDWIKEKKQIKIFQNLSDSERNELLGRAWCCLATSVREGWGRMVLECGMMRTPAVVYDVHGLRDAVIHTKTGFVVPEDIKFAADRIIDLFKQPEQLHQMGNCAREYAERFTWDESTEKFEQALYDAVALYK